MSIFWILVLFSHYNTANNIIINFRLIFLFIAISGLILDYLYGDRWEKKYNISHTTRILSNIFYHIIPLIYLVLIKGKNAIALVVLSRTNENVRRVALLHYSKQLLYLIVLLILYCVIINPIEQYRIY
jgi:16S rRNA A1518/A1519 N6-dimethyltransferase RsmA/KsgA/DIM1 with predicted DNA glycosylase/AP lyase activity